MAIMESYTLHKSFFLNIFLLLLSFQTGYSVVSACVVTLRWNDKAATLSSKRPNSSWREGVICLFAIASCGFAAGLFYRINASPIFMLISVIIAILASVALHCRQVNTYPLINIGFSFSFSSLHAAAVARFIVSQYLK